ncbi:ArsR family transcriptional regulator [Fervidicella metallireducens AeB]|uniref:ArsR family transcriptional regulator n=2 Tax=Fervidicella TaxID=1403538 RepID=A0A017RR27_9CLOT|nr:ArsR family transcriptional regulator [Fervidicella metallireducens AeB]
MYVELLAERLDLSASTVSFHLKKLEEAGLVYSVKEQYYIVYHLNPDILKSTLHDLIKVDDVDTNVQEKREENYRNNVISSFFKYGKLKSIPVQLKKKKIVLEEIAKNFEYGKTYSEKEVNLIIADIHDDFCTIRRDMVSEKILTRENGYYTLCKNNE